MEEIYSGGAEGSTDKCEKSADEKGVYFGEREEKAVEDYLLAKDQAERDRIFRDILRPACTKMIESIIRRYNLFTPSEDFSETFDDTMSFLVTKIQNFSPCKGKKAYSYFGTVCKNYLILKRSQQMRQESKVYSYERTYPDDKPDKRAYVSDMVSEPTFNTQLIAKVIDGINDYLDPETNRNLTDNDIKVGNTLIYILNNWEDLFSEIGTKKFNRSSMLYFISENTMLSTSEVRDSMKRFKFLYDVLKGDFIKEEEKNYAFE